MTLAEILSELRWDEIRGQIVRFYPNGAKHLEAFRKVFHDLRRRTPAPSSIEIRIRCIKDTASEDSRLDLFGVEVRRGEKGASAPTEVRDKEPLALSLLPWNRWVGCDIGEETLMRYSHAEIVALSILEATWWGLSEEAVNRKRLELIVSAEEEDVIGAEATGELLDQICRESEGAGGSDG